MNTFVQITYIRVDTSHYLMLEHCKRNVFVRLSIMLTDCTVLVLLQ